MSYIATIRIPVNVLDQWFLDSTFQINLAAGRSLEDFVGQLFDFRRRGCSEGKINANSIIKRPNECQGCFSTK